MPMRCDVGSDRCVRALLAAFVLFGALIGGGVSGAFAADSGELQIEITKKGLGKEVVITQGAREWFLMVEVTPENTVIVRQEKDHDKYLVDESETHDRPLAAVEVDAAIADYINSVKARALKK
ncbi:MAG: hypothetical protein U0412_14240 [Nitrospira sp.]